MGKLTEQEKRNFADPWWRLSNLYTIVTDDGQELPFRPNEEQTEFFRSLWYRNLILKARQLGFTTFVDLMALDQCVFVPNTTAVIVAHTLPDAGRIFRNKVQLPYRKLPRLVQEMSPLDRETTTELIFANGSSIQVSTSARSGTVQFLHVSEMGKIVRKHPEKAKEIVTGAFEAVPLDGILIVESTAEGDDGWFYESVQAATARQEQGKPPTKLDYKLHFFPWWRKPSNVLADEEAQHVVLTDTDNEYFRKVELASGPLSRGQRAWYVKKRESLREDMMREHPSTPEEAFAATTEGRIYGNEMAVLRKRGRIGPVPVRPQVPVNTFWDLGVNDTNAIWLHQRIGSMNRFVRYFQDSGKGMRHYYELLEKWREETSTPGNPVVWGKHYLPHDGDQRIQGYEVTTRKEILEQCGFRNVEIVPRVTSLKAGIDATREALVDVEFDEVGCAEGIECLSKYSREWDDDEGRWSDKPRHDRYSNGADAFRQYAQSRFRPEDTQERAMQSAMAYAGGAY